MTRASLAIDTSNPTADRLTGIYVVYAAVFCLFWSSSFPITKIALIDCPPLVLLTARFAVAAVVLFGIGLATEPLPRLTGRDYAALVVVGLTMHAVHLALAITASASSPRALQQCCSRPARSSPPSSPRSYSESGSPGSKRSDSLSALSALQSSCGRGSRAASKTRLARCSFWLPRWR